MHLLSSLFYYHHYLLFYRLNKNIFLEKTISFDKIKQKYLFLEKYKKSL